MKTEKLISDLKKLRNQKNIEGMARFGINPETALGISIVTLRKIAKEIGTDHQLALGLWSSGIHEARILATIIDNPSEVSRSQMNSWVKDFNSWDLCDQCCNNLFRRTQYVNEFCIKWAKSKNEFTRRAGFVLMAVQSVHNKSLTNSDIKEYFPIIIQYSTDERNFVKKAVNWALRQIGKRNLELNEEAIKVCDILLKSDSKSAQWIAKDARKELTSEKIVEGLKD